MEALRTYTASDMAKIFCEKCNGCGGCCHGMTNTIHLDPYDVDQLSKGLHKDPAALVNQEIALQNEGGLILPYLHMIPDPDWKPAAQVHSNEAQNTSSSAGGSPLSAAAYKAAAVMGFQLEEDWGTGQPNTVQMDAGLTGTQQTNAEGISAGQNSSSRKASQNAQKNPGVCRFLGRDGRCSIHDFRPGYCRLFPLGRDYDAKTHAFRYFIVDNGCPMPGKMKVRISKWLGVPNLARYEKYVSDWHYFCRDAREKIRSVQTDPAQQDTAASYVQQLDAFILKVFYLVPYDASRDFYELFDMRLTQARSVLN